MKGLSLKQKQVLGAMARRSWLLLTGSGAVDAPFDAWRHAFTKECCGVESWMEMGQKHYIPLLNGLRRVQGLPPVEDNTPQSKVESLVWTIRDCMRKWELRAAYVAAIVADKFARPHLRKVRCVDTLLAGLGVQELMQVIYTLERCGKRISERTSMELGLPMPKEIHASPATMPPPRLAAWRGDTLAEAPRSTRRKAAARR